MHVPVGHFPALLVLRSALLGLSIGFSSPSSYLSFSPLLCRSAVALVGFSVLLFPGGLLFLLVVVAAALSVFPLRCSDPSRGSVLFSSVPFARSTVWCSCSFCDGSSRPLLRFPVCCCCRFCNRARMQRSVLFRRSASWLLLDWLF